MSKNECPDRVKHVFRTLANPDTLNYHIAHARDQNVPEPPDSQEFCQSFHRRVEKHIDSFIKAVEGFKK